MHSTSSHVFAIGDVHGRADLLEVLLSNIADEASSHSFTYRIIFLGDIIDKGPDSRLALDLVTETLSNVPGSHLILGNHDAIPLLIFDEEDPERAQMRLGFWISNQHGWSTLASYGLDPTNLTPEAFRDQFNRDHVAFLRAADRYVELEHHILVHAGLRPGIPLAEQAHKDLMWIREPFLSDRSSFGKMVIHGHTPTMSGFPEIYPDRIGIDTGACASGHLSAAHIVGSEVTEFLWTTGQHLSVEPVNPKHLDLRPSEKRIPLRSVSYEIG